MISKFRCLLPCAMAVMMVACAPLTVPPREEYPVGRARLVMPTEAWQDLGATEEIVDRSLLQTRAVGLRNAQGAWLAVVRVQTNRDGRLSGSAPWSGACPPQDNVAVQDAAASSPVRMDCLRLKRWASNAQWLDKNRPGFARWLTARQISVAQPYLHVGYWYATAGGATVVVDALVDQRLLVPRARNNEEFLAAGLPARQWARELSQAARLSIGMMDGYLAVPPFPLPDPDTALRN